MNRRRDPLTIVALVCGCYEFVLALFIVFQILLAVFAQEIAKFIPFGWPFSGGRHVRHNSFCSGHFPPFSPCRERESRRLLTGARRTPTRFCGGSAPARSISNVASSSSASESSFSKKAGLRNHSRSFSFSSVYSRTRRQNSASQSQVNSAGRKGSTDGELYQCIAPSLDLYDDLIEVSSEYLKQKDRGHEEVILSLLKALQEERRNLRTLYEELDEERVASETAANEAMSMILRLQEEKSALQMEADHYQRMAEEKAIHDEHAIRRLEEDLRRKEDERLLLEDELIELQRRAYSNDDDCDMTANAEKPLDYSVLTKRLFLLTDGTSEVLGEAEQYGVSFIQRQESGGSQCSSFIKEVPFEELPSSDIVLKRSRSASQSRRVCDSKEILVLQENMDSGPTESTRHLGKYQSNEEDDTEAILNQLSVVEKQLLALEETEKLELWQQAWTSQNPLINKLMSSDGFTGFCLIAKDDNNGDSQMQPNTLQTSEMDASTLLDEERVVKVDVTNVFNGPCEMQAPASEEILEIQGNQRIKDVQWEASEEEKHLDLLSCMKQSDTHQGVTSQLEGTCKPISEEENWNLKRVTLEDINVRLQALESESAILRQRPAPSNHEQVNLLLLREIMKELQDLLKANKHVADEVLISTTADTKGEGQYRKRHYLDGSGHLP